MAAPIRLGINIQDFLVNFWIYGGRTTAGISRLLTRALKTNTTWTKKSEPLNSLKTHTNRNIRLESRVSKARNLIETIRVGQTESSEHIS